ncbi:MAG TPA: hypothetical protein VGH33_12715 [Isosphaeraceae bacterium]|jgi:hypothetical protein
MNSRRRSRSPRLEALETRQLLSTVGHAHAHVAQPANTPSPAGFFTSQNQSTTHGAGGRETLKTTFSGSSIAEGPATATVTEVARNNSLISVQAAVQTAKGSFKLAFGPSDVTKNISSAAATEIVATYHITSGTRAFAHATGTGTIAFWWIGGAAQSNMTITPSGS